MEFGDLLCGAQGLVSSASGTDRDLPASRLLKENKSQDIGSGICEADGDGRTREWSGFKLFKVLSLGT